MSSSLKTLLSPKFLIIILSSPRPFFSSRFSYKRKSGIVNMLFGSTKQKIMSDSNTITFFFTVVVAFVVIRWFINSEPANPDAGDAGNTQQPQQQNTRRNLQPVTFREVTPGMIEIVQSMAPNLTVEQIRYSLESNNGNIEATVDQFLAEGTLPFPPGQQPPTTAGIPQAGATLRVADNNETSAHNVELPKAPSLIEKYNLKDKIENNTSEIEEPVKIKWSQKKEEREKQLKKQREEMILRARRKFIEKEAK
jgi:coupling of ubiquitin conjugation to ER degradation protein 1